MDGIINVYKEAGFTSHDVVAKLRGICRQKKIGHTGTLDPQATGVLPVCLGSATRACEMLTDRTKEYVAELLLGQITDTQDTTGTVLEEHPVEVTEEQVKEAVDAGADIIMLDNMTPDTMRQAVELIDGRAQTECSGNITKENIARICEIGVDFVSSGALTHSAPIMDISLKNLHRI